jgi:hypothetical protein
MRRVLVFATVVGFLLLGSGLLWGALPAWVDSGDIQDGDKALKVQSDSIPTCADWNNDGAIDLVVGQFTSGNIWLYLNQGTNANPIFNGGDKIESAGTPITTTYG